MINRKWKERKKSRKEVSKQDKIERRLSCFDEQGGRTRRYASAAVAKNAQCVRNLMRVFRTSRTFNINFRTSFRPVVCCVCIAATGEKQHACFMATERQLIKLLTEKSKPENFYAEQAKEINKKKRKKRVK